MHAGTGENKTSGYLVPAVGVSSTAKWKKREKYNWNKRFSIQKGHENLYKYQKDLVMQSSICKNGIKRRSDIDDEIYLVVMMSALYSVDIDIILDHISLLFRQTQLIRKLKWCHLLFIISFQMVDTDYLSWFYSHGWIYIFI